MSSDGKKMTGEVAWFNPMRSYGFISCDDNDEDAYVSYQDIIGDGYRTLNAGDRVSFRLVDQGNGDFKAVEITDIDGKPINNDLKRLPPKSGGGGGNSPNRRGDRERGRGMRRERGRGGGRGGGGGMRREREQYQRRDNRGYNDYDDEKANNRGGNSGRRERVRNNGGGGKASGKVLRGEVVWFNARRGYGWISVPNEKEDAYVSYGDIKSDGYARLNDGEEVEFKLVRQDGGDLKAVEVTAPGGGPVNNDLKRGGAGRGRGDRGRGRDRERVRDRR